MTKKTYQLKLKEIKQEEHVISAQSEPLGRLATKVVVTDAKEVRLTGKKASQKTYRSHSGYPGGYRELSAKKFMEEKPERVIEHAVRGMLPKNRLQDKRMRRLTVNK